VDAFAPSKVTRGLQSCVAPRGVLNSPVTDTNAENKWMARSEARSRASRRIPEPEICSKESTECLRAIPGYARPSVLPRTSDCDEIPSYRHETRE
jgi:hypothetical protein